MFAFAALILFIVATVLAWTDSSISIMHLLAVGFAGLACLAAEGIYVWRTRGRP